MNQDYLPFCESVTSLMKQKGLLSNKDISVKRFMEDFLAHAYTGNAKFGDGMEMIEMMMDGKNLFDGSKFDSNFSSNLSKFVSPELAINKTFQAVIKTLTTNKSKGVGIGELILPFLVNGWVRSTGSDGIVCGGNREIKNGEASSLKPIKTGLTEKGLVDRLNKKYFDGKILSSKSYAEIISKHGNFSQPVYTQFFTELYPTANIADLIKAILPSGTDRKKFHNLLGRWILKEYQKIDGWKSIIFIHPETGDIVNIADINDDTCFNLLKFRVRLFRAKDTQAVSDGYAVVNLVRQKKLKKV